LFALANGGIHFDGHLIGEAIASPITPGIVAGYVVGEPLGTVVGTARVSRSLPRGTGRGLSRPVIAAGGAVNGLGFAGSSGLSRPRSAPPDQQHGRRPRRSLRRRRSGSRPRPRRRRRCRDAGRVRRLRVPVLRTGRGRHPRAAAILQTPRGRSSPTRAMLARCIDECGECAAH
jgi:hypothetical protein